MLKTIHFIQTNSRYIDKLSLISRALEILDVTLLISKSAKIFNSDYIFLCESQLHIVHLQYEIRDKSACKIFTLCSKCQLLE